MDIDPSMLANNYLCLQREVFVNFCHQFIDNVNNKNKSLFSRAVDFSKDFNNCEAVNFESLVLNEESYPIFCNYVFDFMNYVRKLDDNLFKDSINHVLEVLSFPTFPTLHMSIQGCGSSLIKFLEARENNTLDQLFENENNEEED